MTDRLIRITTALAVATVAPSRRLSLTGTPTNWSARTERPASWPGSHRRRPDPRGEHVYPRRQPAQPAAGALVPRRWHHGHDRRQPGARHRPRPDRRAGQRLASPGAGWLLRTAHDPDQD